MSNQTIENATPATEAESAKGKRKPPKATKKSAAATKSEPNTARSNKKAVVIALMKRAKGATLAEVMKATGWQAHTVRGFVSILGKKGGEKIESSQNADGQRTYRIK